MRRLWVACEEYRFPQQTYVLVQRQNCCQLPDLVS